MQNTFAGPSKVHETRVARTLRLTPLAWCVLIQVTVGIMMLCVGAFCDDPVFVTRETVGARLFPKAGQSVFVANLCFIAALIILVCKVIPPPYGVAALKATYLRLRKWTWTQNIKEFSILAGSYARPWHVIVISALVGITSVMSKHGGIAHPELRIYLPHYLGASPLVTKLLDFRRTEFLPTCYEPRHLSYFLDFIDAQIIGYSFRLGFPHFLSVTYYVLLTLTCIVLWRILRDIAGLDVTMSSLLLLMFQTTPAAFGGGMYFRSAKPGLTLCVLAAAYALLPVFKKRGAATGTRRLIGVASLLLFVSSLFDLVGIYLIAVAAVNGALQALGASAPDDRRTGRDIVIGMASALLMSIAYGYILAPLASYSVIGQWPDFSYQHGVLKGLLVAPVTDSVQAIILFLDYCRYFFGNGSVPMTAAILTAIGLGIFQFRRDVDPSISTGRLLGLQYCATILLLSVLVRLLVARHPPLLWVDVRRSIYGLLFAALACILAGLSVSILPSALSRRAAVIRIIAVCLLAGNLIALPDHLSIIADGHLSVYRTDTTALVSHLTGKHLGQNGVHAARVTDNPLLAALKKFAQE